MKINTADTDAIIITSIVKTIPFSKKYGNSTFM